MKKLIGWVYLLFSRWTPVGEGLPKKCVIIAAPHSTNWDLANALSVAFDMRIRFRWVTKDTLFRWWNTWFFRFLGGIPINRRAPQGQVAAVAAKFAECDELVLCIAPEGTRSRRDHWKSGFYHIALGAGVPIALGFLDYAKKQGGYGPIIHPTGDLRRDMDRIREFYAGVTARFPEKIGPILLKGEEPAAEPSAAPDADQP